MIKVLAFAGSNHSKSINRQVLNFVCDLAKDDRFTIDQIDLRDYDTVMYSQDIESESGFPDQINQLYEMMSHYDGFLIASAEHNGSEPAFFKNIIDWLSRKDRKFFANKPVLLMSTSAGGFGGASTMKALSDKFPRFGALVTGTYSLPKFNENFVDGKVINHDELDKILKSINQFKCNFDLN